MQTIIRAEVFLRALPFTSKELYRYYLQGVSIEPAVNGVVAVATDGRVLFGQYDARGHADASVILSLPRRSLPLLAREADDKARQRYVVINHDAAAGPVGAEIRLAGDNEAPAKGELVATVMADLIDGTYPDWRKSVPDPNKPRGPSAFNPSNLDRFFKAAGKGSVTVHTFGEMEPALVQIESQLLPQCFGIIMPMRVSMALQPVIPEWASRPGMAQAAE